MTAKKESEAIPQIVNLQSSIVNLVPAVPDICCNGLPCLIAESQNDTTRNGHSVLDTHPRVAYDLVHALIRIKTFEKRSIPFKFKEGEKFNRRNIWNISRIKF